MRGNLNDIYIGVNQSGKTTVAEKMARSWRSAKPRSHAVVAHDPSYKKNVYPPIHRIEDITNFTIDPEDENWCIRVKQMRNILLWLDEFRLLNEKNTSPKGLKNVLQMKDHWNIDMVSIFHNPELVLNCFTYHQPRYFIFQTSAKEGSFQKKIPNYNLCITASEQVNNYIKEFGEPVYPKFPYIVVDTNKNRLQAFNMEKKIKKIYPHGNRL